MSATAGQRLSRVLALVPWLVAHQGITITEAAQHFGVSEKELEDDLWLVILCGVPGYMPDQLVDIDFWDNGRISVIEPLTLTKPMRLSHDEALTLLIALRVMAQIPGLDAHDSVMSTIAKLERTIDERESKQIVEVSSHANPEVIAMLQSGLGSALAITYTSGSDDRESERVIQPRRTFSVDGVVYVDAYCHLAEAFRTFRLDRITAARKVEIPHDIPEFEDSRVDDPAPSWSVVLDLSPSARWIVDVHGAEVLSTDPFRVRLPAFSQAWAVRLVMSMRGAATVVEPPSLRAAVLASAREAREAYR
jgi:proteasome accessory factor C